MEAALILLVLVFVATAVLVCWLLLEFGRLAGGDGRHWDPAVLRQLTPRLPHPHVRRAGPVARSDGREPPPPVDDEEVERRVRAQLYGGD